MDPLPDVNKVYSMTVRLEKQQEIHGTITEIINNMAMLVKGSYGKKEGFCKAGKRNDIGRKEDRFCNYCNKFGHIKDTRFKLHGYLEWFHELKQRKANLAQAMAIIPGYTTPWHSNWTDKESWKLACQPVCNHPIQSCTIYERQGTTGWEQCQFFWIRK